MNEQTPQNQPGRHRQIIAGAGSGKTERVAGLIVDSLAAGTLPEAILAITYGVQAAQELKDRILLVAGRKLGPTPGLSQMTVGTIHSICLALLKRHLPRYASYRLLSDAQVYLLIKKNFHTLGLSHIRLVDGPHVGDSLENNVWDVRVLMEVLAVLREGDIDWGQVPKSLKNACRKYKELMHQERALDHTGLLHSAVQALENTEDEHCQSLRRYISETVQHLYVDEYQDVNPIQERLIQTFADLGVCVTTVGDPGQAIFGWRGCDAHYVTTFTQRYGGQQERLENNYRSSPGVIAAAQSFLGPQADPMHAAGHQRAEAGDLQAGQFADPQQEAQFVVRRVQELLGTPFQDYRDGSLRGMTYSDMAVLCRSVHQSAGPIVAALTAAGIPCQVSGLGGLFAAREVQAVVKSFLFLADFPELVREGGKVVSRQAVTAEAVAQAWRDAELGFSSAGIDAGVAYLQRRKARYANHEQYPEECEGQGEGEARR